MLTEFRVVIGACALFFLVACATQESIDCGRDAQCYADAVTKCIPAKTSVSGEGGVVMSSEIRGIRTDKCVELLTVQESGEATSLQGVCEIPLGLAGSLGSTDMCAYCTGSLIDKICAK